MKSMIISAKSPLESQAVIFLTSLMDILSLLLVPISAEAITLDLRGDGCKKGPAMGQNVPISLAHLRYLRKLLLQFWSL